MPLLKSSTESVRIELPSPGEWVEVKRSLGRNDELAVKRRAGEATVLTWDPVTRERQARVNVILANELATYATLEVAIVRWSFPDPVTPENIRDLDEASISAITEALNRLYPGPRTEAEEKNS